MTEYIVDSDETRVPVDWFATNGCSVLVRCRDCSFSALSEDGATCWNPMFSNPSNMHQQAIPPIVSPDGHCFWAEPKEDA